MQSGGHPETRVFQVTVTIESGRDLGKLPDAISAALGSLEGVVDAHVMPVLPEVALDPDDPRLTMTVGDFLGVYGEGSILPLTQTRIKNALLSTNIKNVRDLLAFGSEAIADVDKIRKVAADGLPRVVAASGLQWQPRPGVAEWVQLYHRFGDMPVAALRAKLDYREWSALRSVETVRELLVMEESAVAALLTHQDPYSVRRSAREIITQIMTLAAAFEREKAIRRGR